MCFIMIYGLKITEVHLYSQEGDIVSDLLSNGPRPPAVGEHLAIKYRFDQIKIGEFIGFCAGLPTNENLEVRNSHWMFQTTYDTLKVNQEEFTRRIKL